MGWRGKWRRRRGGVEVERGEEARGGENGEIERRGDEEKRSEGCDPPNRTDKELKGGGRRVGVRFLGWI